jgi:large subunit ribosomal protein L5
MSEKDEIKKNSKKDASGKDGSHKDPSKDGSKKEKQQKGGQPKDARGKEGHGKEQHGKDQQSKEPSAVKEKKEKEVYVKPKPARLREIFAKECLPKLKSEFGYKNNMAVPRLRKIVVNMGLGEALVNQKALETASGELGMITGQKPLITKASKSIATFKLRKGQSIGAMVTLRKDKMYEFFDRLVNIALPRVRDFKGVSPKSFDGRGNYTIGIKEQIIFPEIDFDRVDKMRGMNITIVTSAKTDKEARALLEFMGMPFRS